MSRKSQYAADEKGAELTELLDSLDALIDRTKVMYEQYFMGILKFAPEKLHRDIERKVRELTQQQIRNTALRYRFTTLSQKFGSYNTYWRRVMREIEAGRYVRDIARAQRQAQRRGEELPEEMLAAMPKRMRDRIRRDRDALRRRHERGEGSGDETGLPGGPSPSEMSGQVRDARPKNVHQIDDDLEGLLDDRFDELFQELTESAEQAVSKPAQPARSAAVQAQARAQAQAEAQARAKAKARARTGSAPPPPPGMSESDMRSLYNRYMQARQQVGDRSRVSYERLTRTLHEQAPRIMKQYKAAGVQYKVVVKDDRVILKAQPKRSE